MVDFAKYNGLVARNIPKRSAEEMVASAERRALEEMLGVRRPLPIQLQKLEEAVKAASAEGDVVIPHGFDLKFHEAPPQEAQPAVEKGADGKVALPELVVGLRVRCLDTKAGDMFGQEATVRDVVEGRGIYVDGDPKVSTASRWAFSGLRQWLKTVFPADASLLPPTIGMRVALAMSEKNTLVGDVKEVEYGRLDGVDSFSPYIWYGTLEDSDRTGFVFDRTRHWLRRVWPTGLVP